MLMRNKLLSAARRFGAGIDVSPTEVRLVIASRKGRSDLPVRVEWLGIAPLAPGSVSGAHLVNRAAVAAALSSLCARWPRRRVMRAMPFAMAVPASAPATQRESSATLRVASRRQLEERAEVAAAAGIALAAIDGEPLAALRGLAYAAEHSLRRVDRYAAVWAGADGVYGWRVAEGMIEASIRFPGGGQADLESALRALASTAGLERALVGGDLGLLARVGLTLPDIGDCLGCLVEPFGCASFCFDGGRFAAPADAERAASFAVAFGLALHGVLE